MRNPCLGTTSPNPHFAQTPSPVQRPQNSEMVSSLDLGFSKIRVPQLLHQNTDDPVLSSPPFQTSLLPSHGARHPGSLCQAQGTTSFPLVPAGPQFLEPPEEGQAGRDRQMDSDRLRQSSFHGQAEGGRAPLQVGGFGPPGAGSGSLQSCPIGFGAGVAA